MQHNQETSMRERDMMIASTEEGEIPDAISQGQNESRPGRKENKKPKDQEEDESQMM